MKTDRLYKMAEDNQIAVEGFPLPENKALTLKLGGKYYVAIDPSVLCSSREEKVCLAHELGHCQTEAFYNCYSTLDNRAKQERKAESWAIGQLVPLDELKMAIKSGRSDLTALSDYFGVTNEFMYKALLYYKN